MNENAWGLLWVLSGLPFALVCTAQGRRDEGTWAWALAGIGIGFMFGPFSLLMIVRNHDEDAAQPVTRTTPTEEQP